jgi:hypothetical protein
LADGRREAEGQRVQSLLARLPAWCNLSLHIVEIGRAFVPVVAFFVDCSDAALARTCRRPHRLRVRGRWGKTQRTLNGLVTGWQRVVTNLWSSIVRFVSERLNGGGARAAPEPATVSDPPGLTPADNADDMVSDPQGLTPPTPSDSAGAVVSEPEGLTPPTPPDSAEATVSDLGGLTPANAGLEEGIVKAYRWAQSKFVGGVTELVLLTPITPGPIPGERRTYEERLRAELGSIQRRVDRGLNTPISIIPTIHFAGWLILRPEQYLQGSTFPASAAPSLDPYAPADRPAAHDYGFRSWLFFTSYFDGDLKDYLREFSSFLGKDVDRVWGNCEGYPEGGSMDFEAFWQYAKRYQIETDAFFNAHPNLSVPRIHQLKVFKDRFAAFVRATRNADGTSVEGVGDLLDKFILENQAYTADFPAIGGTYDVDQSNRSADLRKS